MSINPVQGFGAVSEAQFADVNLRLSPGRPSAAEAENPARPDPGTSPSPEVSVPQNVSVSAELQQDEVQVQRDTDADDEIVIKYVDHSGNLILQVPSSEVLDLARAINQDLQQEARVRANQGGAQAESEGGKAHGH
jgi:hypothetical protein